MTWLVPLPVVMPLLGAALTLLIRRRPNLQRAVSLLVLGATLAVTIALLMLTSTGDPLIVAVGAGRRRWVSCWSPTSSRP